MIVGNALTAKSLKENVNISKRGPKPKKKTQRTLPTRMSNRTAVYNTMDLAEKSTSELDENIIQSLDNIRTAFDLTISDTSLPSTISRKTNANMDEIPKGAALLTILTKCIDKLSNVIYPANPNDVRFKLATNIYKSRDEMDAHSCLQVVHCMVNIVSLLHRGNP